GRPPAAWTRHAWSSVDVFECKPGGPPQHCARDVAWLRGRACHACVAIGNPAPFVRALSDAGATVARSEFRRDHAPWSAAHAAALADRAARESCDLATTWKDWTKLRTALAGSANRAAVSVVVPRVEIEFLKGQEDVQRALRTALKAPRG
ncbi:MAG: tetraacyldisaccharide 4'-kinase, partial [Phycisphaerae bacterium]|nr:tetraacyldisaccharide 4'-kinase [Phycisphaerae bacterium]